VSRPGHHERRQPAEQEVGPHYDYGFYATRRVGNFAGIDPATGKYVPFTGADDSSIQENNNDKGNTAVSRWSHAADCEVQVLMHSEPAVNGNGRGNPAVFRSGESPCRPLCIGVASRNVRGANAADAVPERRTRAAHPTVGLPGRFAFKGAAVQSETLKEAKNWT
jgi:hypothetical protein